MSETFSSQYDRRTFLSNSMGYALGVSPITAWAINTPGTDLDIKEITIPTERGLMPLFMAKPQKAKDKSLPCIIVIHEIFGVHEYIKDVCRRLAQKGYCAVSPSLYFRIGDPTKIPDIKQLITEIVSKADQTQVMHDLDSTYTWITQQKEIDAKRVGITGFCWGGNTTWMYSSYNSQLKAGVAWYGKITPDKPSPQRKDPLEIAATLKVPVLGLYGAMDKGIPLVDVEAMKKELVKGKSGSEIVLFPDAEHGFHADYRPSFNEKAAHDGWEKLLTWFKNHGL